MIRTWSLLLPFFPPPGLVPPPDLTGAPRLTVPPLGRGTGGIDLSATPGGGVDAMAMPGTGVRTMPGDGTNGTDPVEALTADGALGGGALADGASPGVPGRRGGALADGALGGGALADGALGGGALADGALADRTLGAEAGAPRTVRATAEAGTGAGGELRRGAAGRSASPGAASVSTCRTWSAVGLAVGSFAIIRPMRSHRTSGTPSGLPGSIITCDLSSATGPPINGGTPQHIS